jgi:hypothetical protein
MRKLFMLMVAALALTTWSFAQDQNTSNQDKDDAAKQDMKNAGRDTKDAAKATGRGVKNGAKWTKDKVTGDDKDKDRDRTPQSDRDADRDRADRAADANRDHDANQSTSRNTAVSREEALERSVHITNGPSVNPSSNSASINWNTNKNAATDVWLMGGGIRGHRVQYDRGGSRDHSVTFSNLRPHTTYTYEIRTREGGDRKQGTFTTR